MKICAILSDYDGTLCPTASLKGNDNNSKIPSKLEKILWNISYKIPICIVSSKDFFFLHEKTKFAKIVSCMMGIETLVLKNHHNHRLSRREKNYDSSSIDLQCNRNNLQCVKAVHHNFLNEQILQNNSRLLYEIVNEISSNFEDISIAQKFTIDKQILAGVTLDYRHINNNNNNGWQSYKSNIEPLLKQVVRRIIMKQQQPYSALDKQQNLHIQTYSTHPFIDIYGIKSDKAMAFDATISQLESFSSGNATKKKIMYLGDSENDNPAFRKADVSICVHSDERLDPKLDSEYIIQFRDLDTFLERLQDNDFVFSSRLLN